jgi:tetratricopeptide (TPR) repeat protein
MFQDHQEISLVDTGVEDKLNISQKFQKALLLLDRGEVDRGEAMLREITLEAEIDGEEINLVRSAVCLGDLLYQQKNYEEAKKFLNKALGVSLNDDVMGFELTRARSILAAIEMDSRRL